MSKVCPILMIGFEAPKKGEKDVRTCLKENCEFFSEDENVCAIPTIAETLRNIETATVDIFNNMPMETFYPEDDYTYE